MKSNIKSNDYVESLIIKLNNKEIIQEKDYDEIDWSKLFGTDYDEIGFFGEEDKHRWYHLEMLVFKIKDTFIGVNVVTDLLSESMDFDDCYHILEFFKVKQVTIISYKKQGEK